MTEAPEAPSELFRTEFLDRGLSEFAECLELYATLEPDALIAEMAFLIRPEIRALPFGLTGKRYYALSVAMIDCAANNRAMDDAARSRLLSLCIDLQDYNWQRTAEQGRDGLAKALSGNLQNIRTYAIFPIVADVLEARTRDYSGRFEESAIGAVIQDGKKG